MRFYRSVKSSTDMLKLFQEAQKEGKEAVGISSSGTLFKWDTVGKKAVPITEKEAASILDVSLEDMAKIQSSRGEYQVAEEEIIHEESVLIDGEIEIPEEKCNCDIYHKEIEDLKASIAKDKETIQELKQENEKLLFENVELSRKANKKPSMTLEEAVEFVKKNGYELRIK